MNKKQITPSQQRVLIGYFKITWQVTTRLFTDSAPSHWLLWSHMTSNNETLFLIEHSHWLLWSHMTTNNETFSITALYHWLLWSHMKGFTHQKVKEKKNGTKNGLINPLSWYKGKKRQWKKNHCDWISSVTVANLLFTIWWQQIFVSIPNRRNTTVSLVSFIILQDTCHEFFKTHLLLLLSSSSKSGTHFSQSLLNFS